MDTYRVVVALTHDEHSESAALAGIRRHYLARVEGLEEVWVEEQRDGETEGDFHFEVHALVLVEAPDAHEAARRVFAQVHEPFVEIDGLSVNGSVREIGFDGGWLSTEWLDRFAREMESASAD